MFTQRPILLLIILHKSAERKGFAKVILFAILFGCDIIWQLAKILCRYKRKKLRIAYEEIAKNV